VTVRRSDWLDRLALRSLAQPDRDDDARDVELGNDHRFSRTAALKLGLAGAAALSLGLERTPAAHAQDRGKCFTDCITTHDDVLYSRLISCHDVFEPRTLHRSAPSTWKRVQFYIFGGGLRDYAVAGVALEELCELKAQHEVAGDKKKCYEKCEADCRQRSVQSASGRSAATCEVTPPPHAPPPSIPPIPNPDSGIAAECANCAIKGGECCAGADAMHLCGCADYDPDGPETPCQRVGCG
jgi:hypothetical protein